MITEWKIPTTLVGCSQVCQTLNLLVESSYSLQYGERQSPRERRICTASAPCPSHRRLATIRPSFPQRLVGGNDPKSAKDPKDLHPVLKEFKELIEGNTRIYLLVNSMFQEIPAKKPSNQDPVGHNQVRDYPHMLELFTHLLTHAPEWSDKGYGIGMVGTPVNAILDWPMGTPGGFAFFLDPDVNRMLKKILNAWGKFLSSPESAYVLGSGTIGWFSDQLV